MGAPTASTANALLGSVAKAQEGLGRWYSYLGNRVPMNMERWAVTLLSVASTPGESPVEGIATVGIPALFNAGFTKNGKPNTTALPDPGGRGAALAISAFDAFRPARTYALLVTQRALERRREDGTVSSAGPDDAQVQALYAAGFARRSISARRRSS